jgi:endonuclease III
MNKKKLERVIAKLEVYFNDKRDEKKKNKPTILDLLIATKLSQNTTDKTSYRAFMNLKANFESWDKVASAPLTNIKDSIKVCGLANTKATQIKKMLNEMIKNYGTLDLSFLKKMNDEKVYEELLQYDGLGVKTISCVLAFSLGRDVFPVDTHVHRVLNRLGLVHTKSAEKTFEDIKDTIPAGKKPTFHTNLIKFGRNICKATTPFCSVCFLYSDCEFPEKEFFRDKEIPLNITENNFIILENI